MLSAVYTMAGISPVEGDLRGAEKFFAPRIAARRIGERER
jgi:hypothetical protein